MESRMDKIFQAYIDNEISLDEICTKFNITSVGGKIKFPFGKIKLP